MTTDTIVILDFGSQYTQLITRIVREQSTYSLQLPWSATAETISEIQPAGIILSGGPASIYSQNAPKFPTFLLSLGIPMLGICYGMQAMADALEGEITASTAREFGYTQLITEQQNPLIPTGAHQVWMSHGDQITKLPDGFSRLATTENTPLAAMGDLNRQLFGVQFHPEVKHTSIGTEIIRNFLFHICNIRASWTPASIIEESVSQIKNEIGNSRVLSAVSGGVDSSVATALVHKAVGNQLDAVFVDTGLLRKNEVRDVKAALQENLQINLITVPAANLFFQDLKGISDPEEKRSRIGNRFIRIFEEEARNLGTPDYLVQGTIYPDVVVSAAPDRPESETIKTHHNVGGLPENMSFSLIEPLRYLFKDEVRKIGEELGLPHSLVWRQPFPGPGLAIRCLGEVTSDRVDRLREADSIFLQELEKENLLHYTKEGVVRGSSQAFAVLLPVKAVGVMGDQRTYEDVIALRAVTTDDFMTADWARFPSEILARISNRIVNEVKGINRVVYDITSKPPGTIEWE
ncbi:MAG: glutamine-hydrolyzing GMP synthase [Anaerolineales bacterium]|nr:glutamine-hydrolyzing GMP synthase [Anaerolineales bacterium]